MTTPQLWPQMQWTPTGMGHVAKIQFGDRTLAFVEVWRVGAGHVGHVVAQNAWVRHEGTQEEVIAALKGAVAEMGQAFLGVVG